MKLWDLATKQKLPPWNGFVAAAAAFSFSPVGNLLAVADRTHGDIGTPIPEIKVWNLTTRKEMATLRFPAAMQIRTVDAMAFSGDAKWIVVIGQGVAGMWDAVSWSGPAALWFHAPVANVAFSPDARTLMIRHREQRRSALGYRDPATIGDVDSVLRGR